MVLFIWVRAEQGKVLWAYGEEWGAGASRKSNSESIFSEQDPKMTWLTDVHWSGNILVRNATAQGAFSPDSVM